MKISNVSNNVYRNNSNVNFNGIIQGKNVAIIVYDEKISPKSKKMVKALDDLIERTWSAIRKKELIQDSPFYSLHNKQHDVFVKPIYTQRNPFVLFEVDDGTYIEKLMVDRKKPTNFRYEKTILTDHGSATLKSYNSEVENDYDINNRVNEIIEKTVDKILPKRVYLEHFENDKYRSLLDY